jgi:hypothetical protein
LAVRRSVHKVDAALARAQDPDEETERALVETVLEDEAGPQG